MVKILPFLKKQVNEILFPAFCVNCREEGTFLCSDCLSLIDIFDRQYCAFCQAPRVVPDGKTCPSCKNRHKLDSLFCASSYKGKIVKKLINQFKYQPYARVLAKDLVALIFLHFSRLGKPIEFLDKQRNGEFLVVPVPSYIKKMKFRGFNPSQDIAKIFAKALEIEFAPEALKKIKETPAQAELGKEQRMENIKGVFACSGKNAVKNRKILLIDDVFTTGSTIEECARVLKSAGAKEVLGIVVARG